MAGKQINIIKKTGLRNLQSELKQRAEIKFKKRTDEKQGISLKYAQSIIHELQVYQIELEMQNEELRKAQIELEESHKKYADLYDFAPVSYFTLDKNSLILEANLTGAALLGIERSRLIEKPFSSFIEKEHQERFYLHLRKVLDKSGRQTSEIRLRKKDGTEFYAFVESIQVTDLQGNKSCRTSLINITERKKAGKAILNERDFNQMIIASAGEGICVCHEIKEFPYMQFTIWNDCMTAITGYSMEEINCSGWYQSMYPDPVVQEKAIERMKRMRIGDNIQGEEWEITRADGQKRQLLITTRIVSSSEDMPHVLAVMNDITDRKHAEEELKTYKDHLEQLVKKRTAELVKTNVSLRHEIKIRKKGEDDLRKSHKQLQDLTAHIELIREKERSKIARNIHDELGQSLTALHMDLSWLKKRLQKGQESLSEKAGSMLKLISMIIKTVQRISSELRPGLLDDLGLAAAIEWQAKEFQKRAGIECKVSADPKDIVLDKDRSTIVFRVLQEALTNVARHANATGVRVNLKAKPRKLLLEVKDNGKGITKGQILNISSFGLIGIKERINALGGCVKINGIKNKGTTVTVSIPIN